MATARQIEANRKNAQKATGPRTEAGRAISSQNAIKTGIHAQSEIIRTESQPDYAHLIAEYYQRFRPAAPEERALVDDLIRAEWLGRRYMQAAAKLWQNDAAFLENSTYICRAQRCIGSTQRNFAAALKQLLAIQAKRRSEPAFQPIAVEPLSQELVSFRTLASNSASDPVPDKEKGDKYSIAA